MKKIIFSLFMLAALVGLASCTLESGSQISFTSLPQPVYNAGHTVSDFKNDIKISINGQTAVSLQQAENLYPGVVISGIELDEPGTYTLVVVYNSTCLTYKYQVVSVEATSVSTLDEFKTAIANEQVNSIKLEADITSDKRFTLTHPVTIYGNGHTIKVNTTTDDRAIDINGQKSGTFAFYDLNVVCDSTQGYARGISLFNNSNIKVIIDNTSIYCDTYYALNVASKNSNIEVVMKNGSTAGGYCAINWWASDSILKVYDTELKGENIHSKDESNNFGVVVINSQDSDTGQNNEFIFENTKLTATTLNGNSEYILILQNAQAGGNVSENKVEFNNCIFTYATFEGVVSEFCLNHAPELNEIFVDGDKK